MGGITGLIFNLMLATFFTHELDAVTQSEWRLLYVLHGLPDSEGAFWFVALHVPLFAALVWFTYAATATLRDASRTGLAVFMLVHAGLHYHLRNDPLNTFNSPLSLALIYGSGLLGLLYLFSRYTTTRPFPATKR